jgi:hypothetical protein
MASEIANVLVATLSADTNTRIAAELRLNELFRTPGRSIFVSWDVAHLLFEFSLSVNVDHACIRPSDGHILCATRIDHRIAQMWA